MNSQEATDKLTRKGIKPTANRILVYKALLSHSAPMSLGDMETLMPSMDKSSIFRTLTLFLEHDVVHAFEDGRGILNYELCEEEGKCDHHDGHIHFYCETCQRSFCLDDIHIPSFELPEGFCPHSVSFVIKGECPECKRKNHPHSIEHNKQSLSPHGYIPHDDRGKPWHELSLWR